MAAETSPPERAASTRSSLYLLVAAIVVVAANAAIVAQWERFAVGPPPEWPVMFDLLVLLPLGYLAIHWRRGRPAVLRALALAGLGTLAGSLILPDASKQLWRVVEDVRLVVVVVVAVQAGLLGMLVARVVRQRDEANLEVALHHAIGERFGDGPFAALLRLEGRVWLYAAARAPARIAFPGLRHFHVGRQGMNASSQAAFLVIAGAEIPVAHLLVHLISPTAAIVVSALSLYGFLFLFAEYHASLHRPISVTATGLHVRYGVASDFHLDWTAIAGVQTFRGDVRRAKGRLRLRGMGEVNVLIDLVPGSRIDGIATRRLVEQIYLGVDDPAGLIHEIRSRQSAG